jgi:hypothetical protein
MRPIRLASAALLAGALTLAAGCGGSEVDPDQGALGATGDPTPTTAAPTPSATPTPSTTPSATATRTPKATATADEGDGGDDGSQAPSTAGGGVCGHLGASQVGAILGVTVTGAAVPGETGCKFDQGGKRGTSVTVLDKSTAAAGGMAGAKTEANSAVEGEPQDVPGIGSAAFVVTGSMFGGPDVNAAGAVQVGSRIISVYLVQRSGLPEAKVRSLEVDLLELVAKAKAS